MSDENREPAEKPIVLVKDLLRPLVKRGETVDYLARSLGGGWYCSEYYVQ